MASTKEIRRRIRSIRSTRQITKAMELVSAAKMRRAQQQALSSRTYARLVWELVSNLMPQTHPELHRLLREPQNGRKTAIILMASNRGLIGAFNNNITAKGFDYAKTQSAVAFITLGNKGRETVKKTSEVAADFEKLDAAADVLEIRPVAKLVTEDFISGKYDRVVVVYMRFVSTLTQVPEVLELLPLPQSLPQGEGKEGYSSPLGGGGKVGGEYLFEPTPDAVLETLLPRLVEMQIYQALLETNAAEHSARMVAMKNASDAASDLVDDLTLEYNQIRQAGITTEISEIVAGRLALQEN
ncbi:MAG: ATP synthase F1 subunit gamma [Candidatus Doudnabacteria bacterium]|nr:ATP synthase F1 subunit gamma [Candidatus Doudnabacteria bacterium]